MELGVVVDNGRVHLWPGHVFRAQADGGENLGSGLSAVRAARDERSTEQAFSCRPFAVSRRIIRKDTQAGDLVPKFRCS